MTLTSKVVVGLIVVAGLAIAALYAPSSPIGEETATVVVSAISTDHQQRKRHRLEVRLSDGTVTPVHARSMTGLETGSSVTIEKRRSWAGYTFYVWNGPR